MAFGPRPWWPVPGPISARTDLLTAARIRAAEDHRLGHEDGRSLMTVVDNAVYVDGRRTADPTSPDETFEPLRERKRDGLDRVVAA